MVGFFGFYFQLPLLNVCNIKIRELISLFLRCVLVERGEFITKIFVKHGK